MNKKKVFVTSLAVCLIAILSFGTLAWFNASDKVTNKFMVANSEGEADKIFSVDVWEYVDARAWTRYDEPMLDEENTLTYVYYLNYKLAPTETAAVFNTVVLPTQLTQQHVATLGGSFELNIVADALQADNTGTSAYEAFESVGWTADKTYEESQTE